MEVGEIIMDDGMSHWKVIISAPTKQSEELLRKKNNFHYTYITSLKKSKCNLERLEPIEKKTIKNYKFLLLGFDVLPP